jgi:hypothetical protein
MFEMKNRKPKAALLALLASGTLFQLGCLGTYFSFAVQGLPGTILAEFLLDNDSIFDLFEDGGSSAE